MSDRHSYLQYDAAVESVVNDGPFVQCALVTSADGARIEMHPTVTRLIDSHGGIVRQVSFSPLTAVPSHTCDCCERVPAGTIAHALELLDPAHPAAVVLREALS